MRKPRIKNAKPTTAPLNPSELDAAQIVSALEKVGHHVSMVEVLANPAPFVNGLARSVIGAKAFMRSVADASAALTAMSAKAALVDRLFQHAQREDDTLTLDAFVAEFLQRLAESEADAKPDLAANDGERNDALLADQREADQATEPSHEQADAEYPATEQAPA